MYRLVCYRPFSATTTIDFYGTTGAGKSWDLPKGTHVHVVMIEKAEDDPDWYRITCYVSHELTKTGVMIIKGERAKMEKVLGTTI